MNLSSTHLADLIAVLHEELSDRPEVASGETYAVVRWRGRVFAVRREGVDVLGPFATVFVLVRELGRPVGEEKDAEHPPLWYWDGTHFELDHDGRAVRRSVESRA